MHAQGEYPEPTWDEMMEDTERAVKALDGIYDRCLRVAGAIKGGGGNLEDLERLLNQTAPVTEEDRRLAFVMSFLARVKRGSLIDYLFKIRRACLLLLIDGRAAAKALNLENDLDIRMDKSGCFHVTRLGASGGRARDEGPRAADRAPRQASDPRSGGGGEGGGGGGGGSARSSASAEGEGRSRSRRRGGRRNRGRKGSDAGGAGGAAPDAGQARGGGRPVMNMAQCREVLAGLDARPASAPPSPRPEAEEGPAPALSAPDAAARTRESPYLAAVVLGAAPREPTAGPSGAPQAKCEPPAESGGEPPAESGGEPPAESGGEPPAESGDESPAESAKVEEGPAPAGDITAAVPAALPAVKWSGDWADDVDDDTFSVLPIALTTPAASPSPPTRAGASAARTGPPPSASRAGPPPARTLARGPARAAAWGDRNEKGGAPARGPGGRQGK
jgi:hypothetical protein